MAVSANPTEYQEAIRTRAYEIYERRGRGSGSAMDDWLQAEAELRDSHTGQKDRPQLVKAA